MEKNLWLRTLIVMGVLFLGVQLFGIAWDLAHQFSDIILIFVLAWMLAFLLNPAVEFFTIGRETPRILAVSAVYLSVLAVLVAIALLIIPPTATQVSTLGERVPKYAANASELLNNLQPWLDDHHIPISTSQIARENEFIQQAQAFGTELARNALGLAQGVLLAVFDGFLVLILSFYMTLDGPRITRAMMQVTPKRFQDDAVLLIASVDRSFGGYLRATLIIVLAYGAGTAAAMFLLGIPFALPVSAFAGIMLIIPFVGDIVAVFPPVLIGLASVPLPRVAILLVVMIILQQLVLQVLRPRIMGKSVGLHPLWVLFAFLAGARVAGVWGALFSVPVAAIIQTAVQLYYFRAAGNVDREGALARSLLHTTEPHYGAPETVDGDGTAATEVEKNGSGH
jgi:predicted PurR-regulated permease PerM